MINYKNIALKVGLSASLIGSAVGLVASSVHAQTIPVNLTVSPSVIDLTANPGDTLQEKFRVKNNGTQSLKVNLKVGKLASRSTGEPAPEEPSPNDTYISWLKLDQTSLTASPNEWVDVGYSLQIPQDAAFGYYYVLRVIPDMGQSNLNVPGAAVTGEVLIPLLLNVQKAGVKNDAKVVEFKAKSFINQYLPVTFEAKIANNGNLHIRPRGNVFIRGAGEKDIAALDINLNQGAILPQGVRTFETSWSDGFLVQEPVMEGDQPKLDKDGQPMTHLVINWNKVTNFRFGKYTANVVMVFFDGTRDVALEGSTSFWIVPYTALGVILVVFIAAVLVIRFLLRAYIRKQLQRSGK